MHVSSYILKNAFLNANKETKDSLLKDLKNVIQSIIDEHELNIPIGGGVPYFDNKALYQFTIPTKSKAYSDTFTIILQAVRISGLVHDLGHLPFSHQIENALKKVYIQINDSVKMSQKEKEFINVFNDITSNNEDILHEAIGRDFIDILFENELSCDNKNEEELNYIKLIHTLCKYILEEKVYKKFDFAILHNIISGTIDADRLDYVNRDMLASGYIGAANDNLRITKSAVFVRDERTYKLSFFDMGLIDIEHLLEMRFNLYKKVIYNHGIAKTDALLENVVVFLVKKYFKDGLFYERNSSNCIAMLWSFLKEPNQEQKLDIISMLDENWLISLFKKEYFTIKNRLHLTHDDKKYLKCFEEVLFGKRFFRSPWKNLNEFYKVLNFSTVERYKFRESFGYISEERHIKLQKELDLFISKWENSDEDIFFTYQIVSFNVGIQKDFTLFDGENIIPIDEISTLRKRLMHSMLNTVPFYIYTNNKNMKDIMKKDLKDILFKIFED